MKKVIKKAAVMVFSAIGALLAVPAAFGSSTEPANLNLQRRDVNPVRDGRRIDIANMMVVGKYFSNPKDLINLSSVAKKFRPITDRYYYNPVRYNPKMFPNIQTLHVYPHSEKFPLTFPDQEIKTIIYFPGSFNTVRFKQVLSANNIIEENWLHEITMNGENPALGLTLSYTSPRNEKIIFKFAPIPCESLDLTIKKYNDLISSCGLIFPPNMPNSISKKDYRALKSFCFPENLESINDGAFSGCTGLESVTIPPTVQDIGEFAFQSCHVLKNVNFTNPSLSMIGTCSFQNCRSLEKINIPDTVSEIGAGAFEDCRRLNNVVIPNSVKKIKDITFRDCHSLTNVTIPDSVEIIGTQAFARCKLLANVVIPDSVKILGMAAFCRCPALESIIIPKSVEEIGGSAFTSCKNLKNVTINGNEVRYIGPRTFESCVNLRNINIPDSVESIGENAFKGCKFLSKIVLPRSLRVIENYVFSDCVRLREVVIPDSVVEIKTDTFENCKRLERINIPTSVQNIGEGAFHGCDNKKLVIEFNGEEYRSVKSFMDAFNSFRAK